MAAERGPYQPLHEGQFRLLKLRVVEKVYSCTLLPFDLNEAPAFDALSYSWNSSTPRLATIICNGVDLEIGEDLLPALLHLHQYRPPPSDRWIWIDAICIDQMNSEERSEQVLLMADIYRTAARVVVWLGEGRRRTDVAIELIPDFLETASSLKESFKGYFNLHLMPKYELSSGTNRTAALFWAGLVHLFSRRWFTRLWVIQEVVLAKHSVILVGKSSLAWQLLVDLASSVPAMQIMRFWESVTMHCDGLSLNSETGASAVLQCELLKKRTALAEGVPTPFVVQIAQSRNCLEPVDRVWAMLGLFMPFVQKHLRNAHFIDYSDDARKNYWRTFALVTKWHLPFEKNLYFLSLATTQRRPTGMPSWCADWSAKQSYPHFGEHTELQAAWTEKMTMKSTVRIESKSNVIHVSGFKVDEVVEIATTLCNADRYAKSNDSKFGPDGEAARLLSWEAECNHIAQRTYGTSDETSEAHWRTLSAYPESRTTPNLQVTCYDSFKEFLHDMSTSGISGAAEAERDEADRFTSRLRLVCNNRRYFSTRGGRVGIGPPETKPGDQICVLYYGRPLFLLRPMGTLEIFEMIGDAYVHGLVNGEALTLPGRGEDREFAIA
jgi:hypothetical protein